VPEGPEVLHVTTQLNSVVQGKTLEIIIGQTKAINKQIKIGRIFLI